MSGVINIQYPESLANSLKMNKKEFEQEMKVSALVKLYELGKVSSGTASKVLGMPRVDFLELLSRYKVSPLGQHDMESLKEDIDNA